MLDRGGLNGIWMNANGEAKVVGIQGRVLTVEPGGFDYTRDESDNRELLHGVWGSGVGYHIAVGGTLDRSPPWTGVSVQWTAER